MLSSDFSCAEKPTVSKSYRIAELDEKELKLAKAGRQRQSKHGKTWAANAFDKWHRCQGLPTEGSIGDLSEKEDIHDFVNMLLKFVLQV